MYTIAISMSIAVNIYIYILESNPHSLYDFIYMNGGAHTASPRVIWINR